MMTCFEKFLDLDKEGRNPNLEINPPLAYPLLDMAKYYFNPERAEFRKSVDLLTKCYDLTINSPLKELAVQACANLIDVHFKIGNMKEDKKWKEVLKKELLIYYGPENLMGLMERYNYSQHFRDSFF